MTLTQRTSIAGFVTLLLFAKVFSQTTVEVSPSFKSVANTDPFTVSVVVNNVHKLHGASITFSFDATKLECLGISAGGWLGSVIAFGPFPGLAPGVGTYEYHQAIAGSSTKTGSGTLLNITFKGLQPGLSPLTLVSVDLRGDPYDDPEPTNNVPIPCTTVDGQIVLESTVPITLASFSASAATSGNSVKLDWTTLSEINNYGFWIQRRPAGKEEFVDLVNSFIPGHGTTIQPQQYSYTDATVPASGEYEYRLRQVDLDGTDHMSNSVRVSVTVTSIEENVPLAFALEQNYPNPFNPSTVISWQLPAVSNVRLVVCDVLGREVATLVNESMQPGTYHRTFDASGLPSGVYLCRLQAGDKADVKRMVLMK